MGTDLLANVGVKKYSNANQKETRGCWFSITIVKLDQSEKGEQGSKNTSTHLVITTEEDNSAKESDNQGKGRRRS